jgi:hypothetical protein
VDFFEKNKPAFWFIRDIRVSKTAFAAALVIVGGVLR